MQKADQLQALIDRVYDSIEKVDSSVNYWVLRTMGGAFFPNFLDHSFIAIGHDYPNNGMIDAVISESEGDLGKINSRLHEICSEIKDVKRPGLIANQVFRFLFEVKKGDVVIIPSYSSEKVAIGNVESDDFYYPTEAEIEQTNCPFTKRRKMKWVKTIDRNSLDPYLAGILQSHQALTNISHYGETVQRSISSVYIKDDKLNFVINIAGEDHVSAFRLFEYGYKNLLLTQDFCVSNQINFSIDELDLKIHANSPGLMQFIGSKQGIVALLSILSLGGIYLVGGGLVWKSTLEEKNLAITTPGYIKLKNEENNREVNEELRQKLTKSLDSLKIRNLDDAIKLMEAIKEFEKNE